MRKLTENALPKWAQNVKPSNYDSALAYLTLRLDEKEATALVARLREAAITSRRVNDVLRASDHPPLDPTDPGVVRDLKKIRKGVLLSPVLLVSFDFGGDIADGLHRLSAVYSIDPFTEVPCKLVSLTR